MPENSKRENKDERRSRDSGKRSFQGEDRVKSVHDKESRERTEHRSQRNSREQGQEKSETPEKDNERRESRVQTRENTRQENKRMSVKDKENSKEGSQSEKHGSPVSSARTKQSLPKTRSARSEKSTETKKEKEEDGSVVSTNVDVVSGSGYTTPGSGSLNRHNFDWSNFVCKENYEEVKSPRVVLTVGPEPCSCYPATSSNTVSSMLYDKIRCIHCNDIGQTQANVKLFDDGWDSVPRTSKTESFQVRSKTRFYGYPRPMLNKTDSDDDSLRTQSEVKTTHSRNDDELSVFTSVSKIEEKRNLSPPSTAPSVGDIPFPIPRIGYTPQASVSRKSSLNERDERPPGSSKSSKNSVRDGPKDEPKSPSTSRTFRGKYFDNETGKIFEYEINPDYQRGANGWQTKRELAK